MFIYVCIYLHILSYDYIFTNFAHSHITFVNLSIVSCMCSYSIEYTWCSRRHTIFSWVPDFLNTFLWPTTESIYSIYACTQLNNIPIRGWTRHCCYCSRVVSCCPIWVIDVITVIEVGITAPSWKTMTCGWMNHHPSVGKLSSGAVQKQKERTQDINIPRQCTAC